jgi:hypothetical protein
LTEDASRHFFDQSRASIRRSGASGLSEMPARANMKSAVEALAEDVNALAASANPESMQRAAFPVHIALAGGRTRFPKVGPVNAAAKAQQWPK